MAARTTVVGSGRPERPVVQAHDRQLIGQQLVGRHALVAHVAQPRVQAVDRLRPSEVLLDHRSGGDDAGLGLGRQLDPGPVRDAHDGIDVERLSAEDDRVAHG